MADNKKNFECKIAPELHEQWQKLKRHGDPERMAEEFGVSRPTIDKALLYGNVFKTELADKITEYFEQRLTKEAEDARRLERLSNQ